MEISHVGAYGLLVDMKVEILENNEHRHGWRAERRFATSIASHRVGVVSGLIGWLKASFGQ